MNDTLDRIRAGGSALLLLLTLLPASLLAQERIDERRPLDADGRLEVGAVSHDIRVEAWDRDEVHLTGTLDPERHRLEITGNGRALVIRIQHESRTGGGESHALELRVPARAAVSVSTVSGALDVEGLNGDVRLHAVSGRARVQGSPRSLQVHTVSGGVDASGTLPDVELQTVSGDVEARGVTGRIRGQSVSGRIRIEGSTPLGEVRLNSVSAGIEVSARPAPGAAWEIESHSGAIALRVPAGVGAEFDLSSFSGSIQNRLTTDAPSAERGPGSVGSRSLRFRTGDASARVRLRSFSGRLTLEPGGG